MAPHQGGPRLAQKAGCGVTYAVFASFFIPTAIGAAALGVAAYRLFLAFSQPPSRIADRKRRMGRAFIDGRTGLPVDR